MLFQNFVSNINKTPKLIFTEQKRFMEALKSKMLIDVYGKEVSADALLKRKDYLLYFFAASWCGACQMFLPKVKKLYEEVCSQHAKYEFIYVSFDTEREAMMSYFKENHGHWYAIPFEDNKTAKELAIRFDVTHIPYLVVVKKDGTVVSRTAKKELEENGNNVLVMWTT